MPQSKPIGLILLWGTYLALFYLLYLVMNPFIYAILWAGIFTVIFYPLYKKILELTKQREVLSAVITMLIIVFTVVIPGVFMITLIVSESIDFAQGLAAQKHFDLDQLFSNPYLQTLIKKTEDMLSVQAMDLRVVFAEKLKQTSAMIISKAEHILFEIPATFASFFITLFTTFFMLKDGKAFGALLRNLLPFSQSETEYYFNTVKKVIYVTFIGVLLTSFVQGVIAFVSFYFIGINSALLLGLMVAIASLVPVVGSALVWVPLAIYLIASGLVLKGVLVIVVGVLFIGVVDNFVRPIFLHQYLSLHLVLTFFSLFGGIKAFGLIGIFLGPVIISAFIGCCLFYQDFRSKNQTEEEDTREGSSVL